MHAQLGVPPCGENLCSGSVRESRVKALLSSFLIISARLLGGPGTSNPGRLRSAGHMDTDLVDTPDPMDVCGKTIRANIRAHRFAVCGGCPQTVWHSSYHTVSVCESSIHALHFFVESSPHLTQTEQPDWLSRLLARGLEALRDRYATVTAWRRSATVERISPSRRKSEKVATHAAQ